MRNIFITQSRKAAHRRNYASECMAMSSDTTAPNQFHAVALKESLQLVEALPTRERQAILLLGVFEMTYIEAAQHSRHQGRHHEIPRQPRPGAYICGCCRSPEIVWMPASRMTASPWQRTLASGHSRGLVPKAVATAMTAPGAPPALVSAAE